MENYYYIFSLKETETNEDECPMFWSNYSGWTELTDATIFSQKERDSLSLPISGIWVKA
jgi:hypothetical protein